jgi:conjugative transposon TraM protein
MQPNQKQKIKKYFVYTGFILIGCFLIYLIFAPSSTENAGLSELDTTLPDPEEKEIPKKEKAYIEDDYSTAYSEMFPDLDAELDNLTLENVKKDSIHDEPASALERARQARKEANEAVSGISNVLTSAAKEQEEKEEKERKLNELDEQLRAKEAELKKMQVQTQMAPYIQPSVTSMPQKNVIPTSEENTEIEPLSTVIPVSVAEKDIVSLLNQNSRHGHFYGFDNAITEQKNTIRATTFGEQIVTHGQNLRLRLSEPIQVGQRILPANSILVAKCQIDAERLMATISSIEYQGIVTPVALEVYDAADGQPGLCLPGSLEQDAMKEIGADIATSVGATTSQSISVFSSEPNAAEQIKTDVGRGVISGVSKFAARKLMEIKVTVQDGHRVFLVISKR